jgi:hypothetical protein
MNKRGDLIDLVSTLIIYPNCDCTEVIPDYCSIEQVIGILVDIVLGKDKSLSHSLWCNYYCSCLSLSVWRCTILLYAEQGSS